MDDVIRPPRRFDRFRIDSIVRKVRWFEKLDKIDQGTENGFAIFRIDMPKRVGVLLGRLDVMNGSRGLFRPIRTIDLMQTFWPDLQTYTEMKAMQQFHYLLVK